MGIIDIQIKKHNTPLPLLDYFIPLIGDKKEVKIANLGCGPVSLIGEYLEGVKVKVYASDIKDFSESWKRLKLIPILPIEIQNMEKLTYEDNFFDVVSCVNALDHTKDALSAVKEMIRVTKDGGWVYIDCCLDQLDTGYRHFWNAKEDGMFFSKKDKFSLKDLGFDIKFIDNKGERRYNHIIATYQKNININNK